MVTIVRLGWDKAFYVRLAWIMAGGHHLKGPTAHNVVVVHVVTIPSLRQTRGDHPYPQVLGRRVVTIHGALDIVSDVPFLYCIICMNLEGRGGRNS